VEEYLMNAKLTAALLATIFSGAALAAGTGSSSPGTGATGMSGASDFDSLDRDGKGYLTKDDVEHMPALKEDWANIDTDGDGRVDRSEFSRFETYESPAGSTGTSPSGSGTMDGPGSDYGTGTGATTDPATPGSGSIR
jgi:hypothetical protein